VGDVGHVPKRCSRDREPSSPHDRLEVGPDDIFIFDYKGSPGQVSVSSTEVSMSSSHHARLLTSKG
jgi:hypothetical protein